MSAEGSNTGPFGIPPGGPWFVFPITGTIQRQDNKILAYGLAVSGWVGFPTKELAEKDAHTATLASKTNSAISDITGYGAKFIDIITNPKLWIRVLEVLAGLGLIIIGVVRVSGKEKELKQAVQVAAKAAAVA